MSENSELFKNPYLVLNSNASEPSGPKKVAKGLTAFTDKRCLAFPPKLTFSFGVWLKARKSIARLSPPHRVLRQGSPQVSLSFSEPVVLQIRHTHGADFDAVVLGGCFFFLVTWVHPSSGPLWWSPGSRAGLVIRLMDLSIVCCHCCYWWLIDSSAGRIWPCDQVACRTSRVTACPLQPT